MPSTIRYKLGCDVAWGSGTLAFGFWQQLGYTMCPRHRISWVLLLPLKLVVIQWLRLLNGSWWSDTLTFRYPQFARRRKSSNETPHRPGNTSCSSSPGPHPVPEKQVADDTGLWWDTQRSQVLRGLVARQRSSPPGRRGQCQDRVRPTIPALRSLRQGDCPEFETNWDCTVSSGLFGLHSEPLSQQRAGSVCIERCLRYTEWKRENFTFLFFILRL